MLRAASRPSLGGARRLRDHSTLDLAEAWSPEAIRIGIVNIMPRAETYESRILRPLARAILPVTPIWIRLRSHEYGSSDAEHIQRHYVDFEEAIRRERLDGLIVTGAPVEELAYEKVRYWTELSEILRFCRSDTAGVLGICWGGLALAKLLGVEKNTFETKLFGVFQNRNLASDHPVLGGSDDLFWCVHSRHSGLPDAALEAARDAGVVNLLSHGPETGYSILESCDGRYLMHLGHPEYDASRLGEEWARDAELGRRDVQPPVNFDLHRPASVWRSHCNDLFLQWLRYIAAGRSRPQPPMRGARTG
jgi:homoserine O-succinyltransferase